MGLKQHALRYRRTRRWTVNGRLAGHGRIPDRRYWLREGSAVAGRLASAEPGRGPPAQRGTRMAGTSARSKPPSPAGHRADRNLPRATCASARPRARLPRVSRWSGRRTSPPSCSPARGPPPSSSGRPGSAGRSCPPW